MKQALELRAGRLRERRGSTVASALFAAFCWALPAAALELSVAHDTPAIVGEEQLFTATVTDAVGEVSFEWRFGDTGEFEVGGEEMAHTFAEPGHFPIDVAAIDENGDSATAYFIHLAHYPLTELRPTSSTSIVYDEARNLVYSVNQDNDTISAIDPENLEKVGELEVYENPESLALTPQGRLWVVHRDDYAVAVVDPTEFVVESGFRLPYASQPMGIAMSPTGDAAYVTLMALGKLLRLDPSTGDVTGEVDVGPRPRGVAVSHDGSEVYVTRFISPDRGGEVVKVDATTMTLATRIVLRLDSETVDSDLEARGLPNYLFSVGLTPNGRQAWVPGKKDNIVRGMFRDGESLTHDTSVRPLTSIIDTEAEAEIYESRVDLDDRSMPFHVEFTPLGDFAILTLAGSNRVEVRDVYRPTQVFSAVSEVGAFPRASVLAANGRLFVQGSLSRSVIVYDMSALLEDFDQATPALLAEIPTVANEKLPADVLEGKKIFHDAEDTRMAFEGYLNCGGCHFEGMDDGRVWDFTDRGEGLRNTVALMGRKGTGQGPLNWTGTLDEVQDFEHLIRDFFDGTGFLPDEELSEPLGEPKAGLSPELDALAAYLTSLDHVNPSPYRNPDGSLTADGVAGREIFERLGCGVCHGGPEFTNSGTGPMSDVGTLTEPSGSRAGETLFGIDTPTLLGVWETPPYLHDGSAPTLRDVITTKNPDGLHGYVSVLSSEEIDQLVAFLMQIDNELPPRRLPFEPPLEEGSSASATGTGGSGGSGGESATGAGAGTIGGADDASGGATASGSDGVAGAAGETMTDSPEGEGGCACRASRANPLGGVSSAALAVLVWSSRRRKRRAGKVRVSGRVGARSPGRPA